MSEEIKNAGDAGKPEQKSLLGNASLTRRRFVKTGAVVGAAAAAAYVAPQILSITPRSASAAPFSPTPTGTPPILRCVDEDCLWTKVQILRATDPEFNDQFGASCAIYRDGAAGYIVVGQRYGERGAHLGGFNVSTSGPWKSHGMAYIFKMVAGVWTELREVPNAADEPTLAMGNFDSFGDGIAIDGETLAVGASGWADSSLNDNFSGGFFSTANPNGYAAVFYRDLGGADNFGLVKKILNPDAASHSGFGAAVSVDRDLLVVGAPATSSKTGRAYVFSRNAGGADAWGLVKTLAASDGAVNDQFGKSVGVYVHPISGDVTVVVGAPFTEPPGTDAGSIYIYESNMSSLGAWTEKIRQTSGASSGDRFGYAVAVDGDTIIAGAPHEDEPTTGVPSITDLGAAYIFERNAGGAGAWSEVQKIGQTGADREGLSEFGTSVDISKGTLVAGAFKDNEPAPAGTRTGTTYVFCKGLDGVWEESFIKGGQAAPYNTTPLVAPFTDLETGPVPFTYPIGYSYPTTFAQKIVVLQGKTNLGDMWGLSVGIHTYADPLSGEEKATAITSSSEFYPVDPVTGFFVAEAGSVFVADVEDVCVRYEEVP